jgi:hypothetical protein
MPACIRWPVGTTAAATRWPFSVRHGHVITPAFDLATNVIAYLPFGFFCTAAMRRSLSPLSAWIVALVLGSGLSLGLELMQNFLPNRVSSNLDLASKRDRHPARRNDRRILGSPRPSTTDASHAGGGRS